jgi:mRNA interferase MazF
MTVADCLQTRPIDHRYRMVGMRGELSERDLGPIDGALKVVFSLK